jgi:predicted nuclease of predicted toxin-antitoxin system
MRFLVDNQLPPSLARWLRDRGHDAEHVFESGVQLLNDRALWARALADARIFISKDEDFLSLTNSRVTQGGSCGCGWATAETTQRGPAVTAGLARGTPACHAAISAAPTV